MAVIAGLAALAASTGCNSGANITLQATMDPTVASSANDGNSDPTNDGWTNANPNPSGFAMGIQNAKLTSSTTADSFTIFDQGLGDPLFTRLYNSPTKVTFTSKDNISQGTYDRLELQVVFYEAAIQTRDSQNLHTRRLRYYLSDATDPLIKQAVTAHDLLLSEDDFTVPASNDPTDVGTDGTALEWIDQTNGGFCTPRSSCTNNDPYQGNTSFLAGIFNNYPTLTIPISSFTVDSSTNASFVVNLAFGIGGLFFYDDTDYNGQFDSLSTTSPDGKIDQPCLDSYPTCSTDDNPGSADFWIGPPLISSTVISQ